MQRKAIDDMRLLGKLLVTLNAVIKDIKICGVN